MYRSEKKKMTKIFEDIDSLSVNRNICSPWSNADDYWQLINSFTVNDLIMAGTWWLPRTKGKITSQVFLEAQGILYWYREHGLLTDKQKRWLANSIIESWHLIDVKYLSEVLYAY
jgi:hypothetical protein